MHHEIMDELRAIRAQMASAGHRRGAAETMDGSVSREVAEAHALLETYRAQIGQCEKLKVELNLIHDAISRTKRGDRGACCGKSFNGEEMARVNGELGAVVGGIEEGHTANSRSRRGDRQSRATALAKVTSPDQQKIQRGNPGARGFDLRGLQFPGSDRSAHQQGDDHDEVHREPHHRDDGYLGRRRRDPDAHAPA